MTATFSQRQLAGLNRRFSPRRIRIGAEGQAPLEGGAGRSVLYLVGRELCLFLRVDVSRVPAKQRATMVAMAVRRAAPFADPEHDVAWMGDSAAVFYWSRERVQALGGEHSPGSRFRAEAFYLDAPVDEGAVFIGVGGGLESRVWQGGQLRASRWWAQVPDPAAWRGFLRGAGADPDSPMPPAPSGNLPHSARPWRSSGARGGALAPFAPHLPAAALALAGLVVAAFAWQLGSGLAGLRELARAQDAVAALEADMERVLQARSQAEADRYEIEQWLRLRPPAPQLRLMAEATSRMQGIEWRPNMWNQPNPDILEVRFAVPAADSAAVVSAFEESPLFDEVSPSLSPRGDTMTLSMRVRRPGSGATR